MKVADFGAELDAFLERACALARASYVMSVNYGDSLL